MSRSPSQPSSKTVIRPSAGLRQLRLLDIDFTAARERALSQALACCVESMTEEELHALPLAERHALVREVLLAEGAAVAQVTADCTGCARTLELTLDLRSLRLRKRARGRVRVARREVRLPTPADLEACTSGEDLLALLGGAGNRHAVESALSTADPLAEIEINGRCPECGHAVSAIYDLAGKWLAQLRQRAVSLLEEVHLLALRYHWSEQEILNLPESRRQAYLDLCWPPEEAHGEAHAW